ncbi:(Na+)-NQR maturation NqrM [Pseudomaricurvus sp. HS19]|uniref:(Na+)-NQR maturation NqrM n=1 Tax=Pseudomaricurvus sp. HS19 TaxID=2692626 RepID=UPI00136E6BB7|nr:(Na+)-NQR maturation NqrM [Pseudomaricurvus sp. HS19]MYM62143.1 (Na+)-NQR maturation NqrM [Pseudomaricurvus sp. HS19]
MQTFILTLVMLLLFVVFMSVGVLMGRKPLKGSCGGVGKALGEEDYVCDICGGDPDKCEEQSAGNGKTASGQSLAYDATQTDK